MASPPSHINNDTMLSNFRCNNGLCVQCGSKIYNVEKDSSGGVLNIIPLTAVGEVRNGRCLYCYPDPVDRAAPATPTRLLAMEGNSIAQDSSSQETSLESDNQENTNQVPVQEVTSTSPRVVTPSNRQNRAGSRSRRNHLQAVEENATDSDSSSSSSSSAAASSSLQVAEQATPATCQSTARMPEPESTDAESDHDLSDGERKSKARTSSSVKNSRDKKRPAVQNQAKGPNKKPRAAAKRLAVVKRHDGVAYKGTLSQGTIHKGKGVFKHVHTELEGKESIYDGDVVGGKFEGQGKLVEASGSEYEGSFKNGAAHGHGSCIWTTTGWRYVGEWENDERSGKGILSRLDDSGEVYDGEWKNDEPNGKGKLKYEGAGWVEGHFKDFVLEGHGKYKFADGSFYEGSFHQGERSGRGQMTYTEDGQVYEGRWAKNQRNGMGTITYKDGSKFKGTMKDDEIKNGATVAPDGTETKYKNGKVVQ